MNEEIKDPNQLNMFEGILLSPEQEQLIQIFLERQRNIMVNQLTKNRKIKNLLVEAGFIEGKHFIDSTKVVEVTKRISLGSSYNNNQFETELTFENVEGGVGLISVSFWDSKLNPTTYSVDIELNKLHCYAIQNQTRFVKPKTLLEKLIQHNQKETNRFEEFQKKTNLKQIIVDKYTKLYPNSTISIKSEWTKYSDTFEIIEVKFESGSYVQFRLDLYNNKEFMHKKHDAELEKMNSDELLEKFSKQVKKEASN